MLLIVEILIWSLIISIILIPLVRWFWKRWDSPDKETLEYLEEMKEERREKQIWREAEEYDAALKEMQKTWTKSPETVAPTQDVKQAAMAALIDDNSAELELVEEDERLGPAGPPDPMAAAIAMKQESSVNEDSRETVSLELDDIGKGADWKPERPSGPDDWSEVGW